MIEKNLNLRSEWAILVGGNCESSRVVSVTLLCCCIDAISAVEIYTILNISLRID